MDDKFRLILLIGLSILAPIGVYHRIKSYLPRERLDRRQEGLAMLIGLRLLGIAGLIGLVGYFARARWIEWFAVALPDWMRWLGVGLFVVAGLLITWTFRTLGSNLTDTVVTRARHTLVRHGPYRFVRHPFYTSGGLLVAAVSLISASSYFAIVGGTAILLLAIRSRTEEAKLIDRFGDEYLRYVESTGRFVPRLGRRG